MWLEIIIKLIMMIWIIASLFVMPFVYIRSLIKTRKTLESLDNNNIKPNNDFIKLANAIRKVYEKLEEQKIELDYICQIMESIVFKQDSISYENKLNQVLKGIDSIQNDNTVQNKVDQVINNIKSVQKESKQDSISYENKYIQEVLLDDIDVLERKYIELDFKYESLLEAAGILCNYYIVNKNIKTKKHRNKDADNNIVKNNTNDLIQNNNEIAQNNEKEAEQDEAIQRLNELIKRLYKIKEDT